MKILYGYTDRDNENKAGAPNALWGIRMFNFLEEQVNREFEKPRIVRRM